MAEKVEVIITIPKYYLEHPQDYSCLAECVRRGIPLPKGYVRLIDANALSFRLNEAQIEGTDTYKGLGEAKQIVEDAPTIIEAGNAESEK